MQGSLCNLIALLAGLQACARRAPTSAVSLRRATLAEDTPGCPSKTLSTAELQEEQCMPFTDTCAVVQTGKPSWHLVSTL